MPEKLPTFPGRNEPCHCNSGRKYKKCHMSEDMAKLEQMRNYLSLSPEFCDKYKISPDLSRLPLFPWLRPGYKGVGKHRQEERPVATLPEKADVPVQP